jgi:hypothetical protein
MFDYGERARVDIDGVDIAGVAAPVAGRIVFYGIVAYVAQTCRSFVRLRRARIENEVYNMQQDKKEHAQMASELMEAARRRTATIVKGNNINFVGGTNSGNLSIGWLRVSAPD